MKAPKQNGKKKHSKYYEVRCPSLTSYNFRSIHCISDTNEPNECVSAHTVNISLFEWQMAIDSSRWNGMVEKCWRNIQQKYFVVVVLFSFVCPTAKAIMRARDKNIHLKKSKSTKLYHLFAKGLSISLYVIPFDPFECFGIPWFRWRRMVHQIARNRINELKPMYHFQIWAIDETMRSFTITDNIIFEHYPHFEPFIHNPQSKHTI